MHEDNPISLAKDKYAVIRHGGTVKARVSGPRRYSEDLAQGGVEIPAVYTFTCGNNLVFNKFKLEITRLVDENMLT